MKWSKFVPASAKSATAKGFCFNYPTQLGLASSILDSTFVESSKIFRDLETQSEQHLLFLGLFFLAQKRRLKRK